MNAFKLFIIIVMWNNGMQFQKLKKKKERKKEKKRKKKKEKSKE